MMAHSRIYSRTGDDGTTSLVGGARVPKHAPRVEAYGAIDEANSCVGLARAATESEVVREVLGFVQHRLFNCSSRVATTTENADAQAPCATDEDVVALEAWIDYFESRTGPLEHFVLPGGDELSARLHLARTVVRRAERRLVALAAVEPVDPSVRRFLNRLSDVLFAAARFVNHERHRPDVAWDRDASAPVPPG